MGNTFSSPIIRWIQYVSIILTLACLAYVVFFMFFKAKDNPAPIDKGAFVAKNTSLVPPLPTFDLKPFVSSSGQMRDVFSLTQEVSPTGAVVNTPKGQLPDHLKVVGIVIGHPSQIIIEDSFNHQTYFIDEGTPQNGIKIAQVQKKQMIINYQGQNISVPISKN